jgi:DNA (cytosine-5)-methyltransferase 1
MRPMTMKEAIVDLGDAQVPEVGHIWIDESPGGRNTKTWPLAHNARQGEKYAGQHKRMHWNKPCTTLTTDGLPGMRPYLRRMDCHPLYTRTLSELEFRRVSSFPDDYIFPDGKAAERIGNAVPPLFMKAIAEHIRDNILGQVDHG